MRHPSMARVAATIASGIVALTVSASIAAAQEPGKAAAPAQSAACTVKVASDSVPASPTPLVVNASLSSAIGDSVSASLPAESGITVSAVGPSASGGANAIQLTLDTSAAKPGEWALSLKGKTGECAGKLKVAGAK